MALISIIVPVYRVEAFLARCMDSILNQTFSDFDLILIDDGSPDRSGEICDEYAKKDSRIKVIHQENGGLSEARNAGLRYAMEHTESKYLYFVDSDDYIKPTLLEHSLAAMEKHGADIVCFGLDMITDEGEFMQWGSSTIPKKKVYSKRRRFLPILPPKSIGDYVWNKVYKRELFSNVFYPPKKVFEDVYTAYQVFQKASKVVVIPENLYVYIRRVGSITSSDARFNATMDFYHANKEKFCFISQEVPGLSKNAFAGVLNAIYFIAELISKTENPNRYQSYLDEAASFIRSNHKFAKSNAFCRKEALNLAKVLEENSSFSYISQNICFDL